MGILPTMTAAARTATTFSTWYWVWWRWWCYVWNVRYCIRIRIHCGSVGASCWTRTCWYRRRPRVLSSSWLSCCPASCRRCYVCPPTFPNLQCVVWMVGRSHRIPRTSWAFPCLLFWNVRKPTHSWNSSVFLSSLSKVPSASLAVGWWRRFSSGISWSRSCGCRRVADRIRGWKVEVEVGHWVDWVDSA